MGLGRAMTRFMTHVGDSVQTAEVNTCLWVTMVPVHLNLRLSLGPKPIFTTWGRILKILGGGLTIFGSRSLSSSSEEDEEDTLYASVVVVVVVVSYNCR